MQSTGVRHCARLRVLISFAIVVIVSGDIIFDYGGASQQGSMPDNGMSYFFTTNSQLDPMPAKTPMIWGTHMALGGSIWRSQYDSWCLIAGSTTHPSTPGPCGGSNNGYQSPIAQWSVPAGSPQVYQALVSASGGFVCGDGTQVVVYSDDRVVAQRQLGPGNTAISFYVAVQPRTSFAVRSAPQSIDCGCDGMSVTFTLFGSPGPGTFYPFDARWKLLLSASVDAAAGTMLVNPSLFSAGGIAWYDTPLYISDFTGAFDFGITETSPVPADGMCVMMQNIGTWAAGGLGGAFGYGGLSPSAAVCLDTYSGTSPNWLGTDAWVNGGIQQISSFRMGTPIVDGRRYTFIWEYRRSTGVFTWTVRGNGYSEQFTKYIGDLVSILGTNRAFIGFGGATGGCKEAHWVYGFSWAPICSPPSIPANTERIQLQSDLWQFNCLPGYFGASTTMKANAADCVMIGSYPTCTACGASGGGYYCPGQNTRIICPAGRFGDPAAITLTTSDCSGLCEPGFFCAAGATSSRQNPCGNPGRFCPAGSGTWTAVSANFYSGPLAVADNVRYNQIACPADRTCVSGVLQAGIDFGVTCGAGSIDVIAPDGTANAEFGTVLTANTGASYSSGVTWSTSISAADGTCTAASQIVTSVQGSPIYSVKLKAGASALQWQFCKNGLTVVVTAARTADTTIRSTCTVRVAVVQVAAVPVITDCLPRNIDERLPPVTNIGTPVRATVSNTGTTLLWSLTYPFQSSLASIDACSGQIRSTASYSWASLRSYSLGLTVKNTGIAPEYSTSCNLTVTINRVNIPPVLSTTTFQIQEEAAAGTYVGQATATDADPGDVISGWAWAAQDTNAFAISPSGAITVQNGPLALVQIKAAYAYTVRFTDGIDVVTATLTITIRPKNRPATSYPQTRSLFENAATGFQLLPALVASHPQSVPFTFASLAPNDIFTVSPAGVVSLISAGTVNPRIKDTHSLQFTLLDNNGLTSTFPVTITVLEVNQPPVFNSTRYDFIIGDGATPGTSAGVLNGFGSLVPTSILAKDANFRDSIVYRAFQWSPPEAASVFALDPLSGSLTVSPAGNLLYNYSWAYPAPQTIIINVTAQDNGLPPLNANASIILRIVKVRPTINSGEWLIPRGFTTSTVLGSAFCMSPYPGGITGYTITANDFDTTNAPAFTINSASGAVRALSTSFSYNVRNRFNITVQCTDLNGNSASGFFFLNLDHSNRPPAWSSNPLPRLFAAARTSANIGSPLAQFVSDPDAALSFIRENFTFAITAGNTDGTFAIHPTVGQIYVIDNSTASFIYPAAASSAPTYTLTVTVTDAGINGPRYTATTTQVVELVRNAIPPTVGYFNLSVPEASSVGFNVGTVAGSSVNTDLRLSYTITGASINAFFPFPFVATTVCNDPGFPQCKAVISVTGAAPIEFYGQFRRYQATLTATDNAVPQSLSASAPVDIYVTYVALAPYFNVATKAAATAVFSLQVDEHAPANAMVRPVFGSPSAPLLNIFFGSGSANMATQVAAQSKDPWQMNPFRLRYSWAAGSQNTNLFLIDAVGGNVTMAPTAGDLAYDITRVALANKYSLTVRVVDANNLADTARVDVYINDVNDAPVFTGLFDAAGAARTAAQGLTVPEDAPQGTVIGRVTATDPDTPGTMEGTITYSLNVPAGMPGSGLFSVNRSTGAITVAALDPWALNFLDRTQYTVTIVAGDELQDARSRSTPYNVTIRLVQSNRVAVTNFFVPSGTARAMGVNNSLNDANSTDVSFTTDGGTTVLLVGQAFGPTQRRMSELGLNDPATASTITATYGPTGTEYTATACRVTIPFTQIACVTAPGTGSVHRWIVSVAVGSTVVAGGASAAGILRTATSATRTGYFRPSIISVTRSGAAPGATGSAQWIPTDGSASFAVTCINCGGRAVSDPIPTLTYFKPGSLLAPYASPSCGWQSGAVGVTLICRSAPGVGASLIFTLAVNQLVSDAFSNTSVRYSPPVISSVFSTSPLDTAGALDADDNIILAGSQFGPANHTDVIFEFGLDLATANVTGYPIYSAVRCRSSSRVPHGEIICSSRSVQGVGIGLFVLVTVGDAMSAVPPASPTTTLSFRPPVITDISGPGADNASTTGGEAITVFGSQLGPLTPVDDFGAPVGPLAPVVAYGRPSRGLPFNASRCRVTVAHRRMDCLTAPGSGKDLVWRVTLGGQPSAVFMGRNTSYSPPVISLYQGPGSLGAQTFGGQAVHIIGTMFGPTTPLTPIDRVTFGRGGREEFTAERCFLAVAHTNVTCFLPVGAGGGHSFYLYMDGQRSVAPSTSYGAPRIASFDGAGAADASTDGGQQVSLAGSFFSVGQFLQRVTYGPSGIEYTAQGCFVSANHSRITCTTVPGTGRKHYWIVTVLGQSSAVSTNFTSYAPPVLTSVWPLRGTTAGGTIISIQGRNFASAYPAARLQIKLNALSLPGMTAPSPAARAAHWQSLMDGGAGDPAVAKWLEELPTLPVIVVPSGIAGLDNVSFTTPAGFGADRELYLLVDGVPSQLQSGCPIGVCTWSYTPPRIARVAPERVNVTVGYLRVTIEGSDFGANELSGRVEIDGRNQPVESWTHDKIVLVVPEPRQDPVTGNATVQILRVVVGGQVSNERPFSRPVPGIASLVGQGAWFDMKTEGGQPFFVAKVVEIGRNDPLVVTIGGRICPYVDREQDGVNPESFVIRCNTPPGVGANLPVLITVAGSAESRTLFSFSYARPALTQLRLGNQTDGSGSSSRMLQVPGGGYVLPGTPLIPTLGTIVAVRGTNLGTSDLSPATALTDVGPATVLQHNHTVIVLALPPGDGLTRSLVISVGGQDSPPIYYSYKAPAVLSVSPAAGSTQGGSLLVLRGVDFGITAPNISVGGLPCPVAAGYPSPGHDMLACTLPRGQGKNLPIALRVNGQSDLPPGVTFSYFPPFVASVAPETGPTSGRTLGAYIDNNKVYRRPGDRIVMIVQGAELGRTGLITFEQTGEDFMLTAPVTPVPLVDVLPLYTFNWLLARANGSLARLAGMSISDELAAELQGAAWGAMHFNASDPTAPLPPLPSEPPLAYEALPRAWNESLIAFLMPTSGFGSDLRVNVSTGQPGTSVARFAYDPPSVTRVINANFENEKNKCVPKWQNSTLGYRARERGALPRLKLFFPGCYPTSGNVLLLITGQNFGPQASVAEATTVFVGGKRCELRVQTTEQVSSDHNNIFCSLPPGIGQDLPVTVRVGARRSAAGSASMLSYDPPILTGFDPNNPNARGIPRLGVKGTNFGDVPTPTTLTINGKPCTDVDSKGSDYLFCSAPEGTVGAKNISLLIANRTEPTEFFDVEEELVYTCKRGEYGLEGEFCLPCPNGANCPGDERFQDLVNSTAGFWRSNASLTSEEASMFCEVERILTRTPEAGFDGCPIFQPCEPVGACLGNNTCLLGYVGERCANCLPMLYYRVGGECVKCPDNLYVLYGGLAVLLIAMGIAGYYLNKKNVSLALIAIGVDYFQVVSLFARARIRWPEELKFLFQILSIFNLNIEIVAPECLSPNLTFAQKWAFIELMPLSLMAIFVLLHFLKLAYKAACTSKSKKQLNAHLPTLVSTLIVVFRVLYLYLTKTSMDVLSCLSTTPPEFRDRTDPRNPKDPILYMAGQIDYPCWKGIHLLLFPLGLFALGFYSVLLPAGAIWWLRKNREAVKYDQILRCKGIGNDELSNPRYYRWRKMWSKLYLNYKPGKWYWEIVIISRKFLFALTGLMFRQVGAYQLSMALLVLFVAFVFHSQHLPYLTHENKQAVLSEHMAKALAGDRVHAMIESDMKAVEKRNTRKRTRQNLFETLMAAGKNRDLPALVVLRIFDANTVEAILLASAILVNLSGVMFDSARFAGDNYYVNKQEYKGLAYGAILLIASTICYYLITIWLELTVVFCPQRVGAVISCVSCCCRAAMARRIKEATLKAEAAKKGKASVGADGDKMDTVVNPFMMRSQTGGLSVNEDGFLDTSNIMSMELGSMTGAVWNAVQNSYKIMGETVAALQGENKSLKHALEGARTEGVGPTIAPGRNPRARQQFRPIKGAEDDMESKAGGASASASSFAAALSSGGERAPRASLSALASSSAAAAAVAAAGLDAYRSTGPGGLNLAAMRSKLGVSRRAKAVVVDVSDEDEDGPKGSPKGSDSDEPDTAAGAKGSPKVAVKADSTAQRAAGTVAAFAPQATASASAAADGASGGSVASVANPLLAGAASAAVAAALDDKP